MDIKNKTLMLSLPKLLNPIVSLGIIDNNILYAFTSGPKNSHGYLFNIRTAEPLLKSKNFKSYGIEKVLYTGEDHKFIVLAKSKAMLFDFNQNKITKEFAAKGENIDDKFTAADLSKDKTLIAVGHKKGNIKLYSTEKFFTIEPLPVTKDEKIEKTIIIKKEQEATKEEPIVLKEKQEAIKEEPKKNIKPELSIYASKKSGYAPLDVNFKIIANDEDGQITEYYLNIDGKEFSGKGNPLKVFNFTFDKPGKFNVIASVKDDQNAVVTKEITINVRKETFEDFKKKVLGKDE